MWPESAEIGRIEDRFNDPNLREDEDELDPDAKDIASEMRAEAREDR